MEKIYISNIKNTKRNIRFMHSEYDPNEPYVVDGRDVEIVDFSYGILHFYNGIWEECLAATAKDFQELQKAAQQTTIYVPCGERYIVNLSKIKTYSYENGEIAVCTKQHGWYDIELDSQADIDEFLNILSSKFQICSDETI